MATKKIEGIILQTVKFQDYDQIATLYTPSLGILKLFIKGAFQTKNQKGALTSPLSRAEFIYHEGKSALYSCREISMLNPHLNLRQNLTHLEAALDLLKVIHDSQWEHAPAPDLYHLLVSYLEKIPVVPDPLVLTLSFRLKVLRHEGVLKLQPDQKTESLMNIPFSEHEMDLIHLLAFSKRFKDLCLAEISREFDQKIKQLFLELL
jgi:DNA repair protein RecO (recombination protein O)